MGCSTSKIPMVEKRTSPILKPSGVITTPTSRKKSPKKDPHPLLTEHQAMLVCTSWQQLCENNSVASLGKKVFLRIFELRPEVKQIFPFRDVWGDELIKHPLFQAHAERFMFIIDATLQNLEGIKAEFGDVLFNLGRNHAHFEGFTKDNFDIFLKSILFVWQQELKRDMDNNVEAAWRALLDYILNQQRAGYMKEVKAKVKGTIEVKREIDASFAKRIPIKAET